MSLHKFAEQVAAHGRGDDSLLIHMTPDEVNRLQEFAQANGTTLTINPHTGLPEAGMLSNLFKALAPVALGAFLGPAGAAFGGGLMSAGAAAATVGGITTLATGSLSRGLMAGLGAYGGAGLGEGLMNAGTNAGLGEALAGSAPSTLEQIAGETLPAAQGSSGQAFNEFLKSNANPATQSFGDMASAGAKAVANDPLQFVKDNYKYLGAAASPIMAAAMVPTTTKVPEIGKNTDTINQFIYGPTGYRALNPVPAAGYGTPSWKPFAAGGIVALAAGGVPGYAGGGGLENIYANLGGQAVYDKIAADYMKAGGDQAGLASIMSKYDTPVAAPTAVTAAKSTALTPEQQQAMNLMLQSSTGGVNTSAMDALGGSAAVKKLAESAGYTGTPTQLYDYAAAHPGSIDWTSDAGRQLAMNNYTAGYTNTLASKFKTPEEQALELFYRSTTQGAPTAAFDALGGYAAAKKLAESAGFDATPEWQQEYERKMGYTVIPRMSTAASIAADKAASAGLATLPRVDAGADTRLDYTGDGTSTVKPVAIKSDGTYKTVAGDTSVAPPIGTTIGQGTYQGTGTMASTGTTGPIMDFTGKTAFGTTSPLALAKQQIADQSAAKTAADKAKLDLYSQWGAANPKATELEHVNFIDKIGLPPETAAQLLNISPDQAKDKYYNAKFNKQTGDSMAAYNYLMGQGAYPTKSGVGEIARPYAEATLGYPASTNRQYVYDQATGKYIRNPDYVAEYKDPSGGVNYLMSPSEIYQYFKTNQGQDDATTYAWAIANNLTPQEISAATGVPLSTVAAKWRAAKASAASNDTKTVAAGVNTVAVGGTNYDLTDKTTPPPGNNDGDWQWSDADKKWVQIGKAAAGGLQGYAMGGGLGSLGSYSDGGRLLKGPGDGVSDSIPATIGAKGQPARLADGEFVVPARIVSELGNGSTEAGARKLYAMMDRVQKARGRTTGKNKVAANTGADKYLPA